MSHPDLVYNGTQLEWHGHGTFNATSGLPGHQNSSEQSVVDHGPIPEGRYSFPLIFTKDGAMVNTKGDLDTREGIERLPSSWQFHGQKFLNIAWGADRVRLDTIEIDSPKNRHRGGFYLHDSTKGFSHGCIEVDPIFFAKLRAYVKLSPKLRKGKTRMVVRVKYLSANSSTYGNTRV